MDLLDKDKLPNLDEFYEKSYYQLGEWLIDHDHLDIMKDDLDGLEKYFHGGGSCTLALFEAMAAQNRNDLVRSLRAFAETSKRHDLLEILNTAKIPDTQKIICIDTEMRVQLASKLDKRIVGVKGWEALATYFKFGYEQRESFKSYRVEPGRFSPTKALFEIIRRQKKPLSVDVIIDWAENVGRNDVANDLYKFQQEVLQERRQSCPSTSPMQSDLSDNVEVQLNALVLHNNGGFQRQAEIEDDGAGFVEQQSGGAESEDVIWV